MSGAPATPAPYPVLPGGDDREMCVEGRGSRWRKRKERGKEAGKRRGGAETPRQGTFSISEGDSGCGPRRRFGFTLPGPWPPPWDPHAPNTLGMYFNVLLCFYF